MINKNPIKTIERKSNSYKKMAPKKFYIQKDEFFLYSSDSLLPKI